MNFFFDTSSLVKIYHLEENSQEAIKVFQSSQDIYVSEISVVEFFSTIHRKFRQNEIDENTLVILKEKFLDDIDSRFFLLKISSVVLQKARELLEVYGKSQGLKTLDGLQLAFFKLFCEPDYIFVASDKSLLNVLRRDQIKTLEI